MRHPFFAENWSRRSRTTALFFVLTALLASCSSGSSSTQSDLLTAGGDQTSPASDISAPSPQSDTFQPPPQDDATSPPAPPQPVDCKPDGPDPQDNWGAIVGNVTELACLQVHNDRALGRKGELATSGVPISAAHQLFSTDKLAVVGPNSWRLPAQFHVLARWGGVVDDTSKPIRWLEVDIADDISASATRLYRLVSADNLVTPPKMGAVTIADDNGAKVIDTGVGRFVIAPTRVGLFQTISVESGGSFVPVYSGTANDGMGPHLELGNGTVIDAKGTAGDVLIDDNGFELFRQGPLKVVAVQRGHFVGANGSTICTAAQSPFEPLGYTMVATFVRGQRDVDLQFNFRNECGDNFGGPWTDNALKVNRVSFRLPLALGNTLTGIYGHNAALTALASFSGGLLVEQRRGAGSPWKRRAWVTRDGQELHSSEYYTRPFVGVMDAQVMAGATMPWMRFREPQALALDGKLLELRFVSQPLIVGESRGIWNAARLVFTPAGAVDSLEHHRELALVALERSLLVRPTLSSINASQVMPSMGLDKDSALRKKYLALLELLHTDTVQSQWATTKTYGSQLWPDIPFFAGEVDDPSLREAKMNYWNASRTELLEFWRSGDPKWVWDWSMPQTWLQLFSAYANNGENNPGNRNGFALTSGSCGWENGCCHWPPPAPDGCQTQNQQSDGHWHRSGFGSDDYTYTHGDVAYVIRPSYPLLRRFAQAGLTAMERYVDQKADRGLYTSQRDITRQVIQHVVLLANCAEFVGGERGKQCHQKLQGIFTELAEDNFKPGVICQRDDPTVAYQGGSTVPEAANGRTCVVPQQFMQNALMLPFFHRVYLNYGDIGGRLKRALTDALWNYYRFGMAIPANLRPGLRSDAKRPAIPIDDAAPWTNQLQYTLSADRTTVESCAFAPLGQPVTYDEFGNGPTDCAINPQSDPAGLGEEVMLYPNRPHTVGWLLVAHNLDPTLKVCAVGKAALGTAAFLNLLDDYLDGTPHGWLKGPAQMMQGMIFALGAFDTCQD